jgi:hypothetical protein
MDVRVRLTRKRVAAFVGFAMLVTAGGVAYATIPDASGVIHGCYMRTTGALRVIDREKGQTCGPVQQELNWNQRGPQGPAGPRGETGPQGPSGTAKAWAYVAANGSLNAGFHVSRVDDLTGGLYCVLLDPSIDPFTAAAVVTPVAGLGAGPLIATTVPGGCGTTRTGVQVQIWNVSGVGVKSPLGFDISVP